MIDKPTRQMNWPLAAGMAAVAAALGFGAAHWAAPRNNAAAAPAAQAPAPAPTAKAEAAIPEIVIPAEYLQVAKIAVEPVASGGLEAEILTAGTVAAVPNSEAVIVARASGNVTRVVRQLGDTVRAGEVLAQVESQEAAAMAAERKVASARAELARKNYARESSLFQQGVTPRQDLEAAQSALAVAESEAQRANTVARAAQVAADGRSVAVRSPIAGKITGESVTLGGFVQPQTELFRVAGGGPVHVEAPVSSADIGRIAAGDKATVLANGAPVEARVVSVTPTVSGNTRSATVILEPLGSSNRLVVGEGVQVRLHVKENGTGMTVPEDAVQNIDGRDVLFVRTKAGFRAQPVLVGSRSRGMAQIVSGVQPGEQVATRNAFLVKADMIKSEKEE
jgi:cobalt-zinc-cadmium efflux system membrane fusion protein